MKRTLTALVTATALTLSVAAATAQDSMGTEMSMGFNMLTGAVFNGLRALGLPTDGINDLTLAQIAQIKAFIDEDMVSGQKGRIKAILDQ